MRQSRTEPVFVAPRISLDSLLIILVDLFTKITFAAKKKVYFIVLASLSRNKLEILKKLKKKLKKIEKKFEKKILKKLKNK